MGLYETRHVFGDEVWFRVMSVGTKLTKGWEEAKNSQESGKTSLLAASVKLFLEEMSIGDMVACL